MNVEATNETGKNPAGAQSRLIAPVLCHIPSHPANRGSAGLGTEQNCNECVEIKAMLFRLIDEIGVRDRNDGNAPGHCHRIPGIWDRDNGDKAGTQCSWCAIWAKAKSMKL
ncbi:MAG: hypothetical protein NUV74_05200 [Candidatus Brocadiaceae bacterium]|nr:hypothetical protein [Candidatus Brocadiaceae bacterium]